MESPSHTSVLKAMYITISVLSIHLCSENFILSSEMNNSIEKHFLMYYNTLNEIKELFIYVTDILPFYFHASRNINHKYDSLLEEHSAYTSIFKLYISFKTYNVSGRY